MNSVLVVDDDPRIRELLSRWLMAAGYQVRVAEDAESGLAAMAVEAAAVVMCDVEMPGHGGLWLAEQLIQGHRTTAIVLATGVDSVPASTSFKPGIVEYLVKPFELDRVLDAVAHGVLFHERAMATPAPPADQEQRFAQWLDDSEPN